MMNRWVLILLALVLAGCTKKDSGGTAAPHGTVLTRDGGAYTGTITSTPSQVTVAGDDHATHILAMKDVRSINYDDATAAAAPPPESPQPAPQPAPSQPAAPPAQPVVAAPPARSAPPPEITHRDHYHPPASVITTKTYELPAGTELVVRAEETIDSATATQGQTYAAEVVRDVRDAAGDVVIPRGANAQIVIVSASKGGRFRGASDLVLDLNSVSVQGRSYHLSTADISERGRSGLGANKRTGEFAGGGAAVGAIIGAIAGGGKGAAIGAGSGAGAGALAQVLTKGRSIRVPVESVLTFRLDQPLRVVAAR